MISLWDSARHGAGKRWISQSISACRPGKWLPALHYGNKIIGPSSGWVFFTSVVGFASLLFSNLPGLAQLGLYAITGLLTAAGVTRLVLSRLPAHHFKRRDFERVGDILLDVMRMLSSARWVVISLTVIAACTAVESILPDDGAIIGNNTLHSWP